jgi:predicted ATP-grasp superfamily ATP-dependent carboligase/lysine/ornithine N-monooxygenase
MTERIDVAVVGAGPFGLSVAAHLAPRLRVRVFGTPMETWRTRMPPQMLLRSAWEESSISAPREAGSIDAWARETGEAREEPIPLEKFLRYAGWFRERLVPELEEADIVSLEHADEVFRLRTAGGDEIEANHVVLAVGITPFARIPPPLDRLDRSRTQLTVEGLDFSRYRDRRVLVVGGGQGGIESAWLAAEAGAEVELVVRSRLRWFADREPQNPRGPLARRLYRLAYPAVGYGPPLLNRLALAPDLLAALPAGLRHRITRRTVRAGGSPWIRDEAKRRLRITEGTTVEEAESTNGAVRLGLSDGSSRDVDDVLVSAGFRFSLDQLDFIAPELRSRIAVRDGWPVLDRHLRSSEPRLFFVGYPAEGRFGPLSRYVLGTRFTSARVAKALEAEVGAPAVLIAGDDHYSALAGLRALREAGVVPWLATARKNTYAARSRAAEGVIEVSRPAAGDDAFIREVGRAAEQLGVVAILPASEDTLVALAEGRDQLPEGIAVGAPSAETVALATDKRALAELATAAGLQVPPTREIGPADLDGGVEFPAVVKPVRTKTFTAEGVEHGRVRRVSDLEELRKVAAALPGARWLVQPFVEGRLSAIAGAAWEGELVCALHQVALRITPPDCGISAYAVTVPRDAELEAAVGRLLAAIGWSGLFQLQFIRDRNGVDYLIDFNPRMYGSLALATAAGLNLPAIWLELLLGRRPTVPEYEVGVRYRAEEKDARALVRALVRGRPGEALRGFIPRRRTAHAVFSLRDPLPLLTSIGKLRNVRAG